MAQIGSALLILLAGSMWGVIGLFTTPLTQAGFSFLEMIGARSLLTFLALGVLLLCKDKRLFRIQWKDLWCFFGMGFLSFVLFNICYLQSIQLNQSLSVAAILLYTAPIFVMLGSILLFHEKLTLIKSAALLLAVGGCVLVSGTKGGTFSVPGLLCGVGSGFGYALYSLFGRYALKRYSFFTTIFYTFVFAAAATAPFLLVYHTGAKLTAAPMMLWPILGSTVISTFFPYIFYTKGLEKVASSKASILACIEPVVATFAGLIAFGQTLSFSAVCGVALVLSAVVLLELPGKKKKESC